MLKRLTPQQEGFCTSFIANGECASAAYKANYNRNGDNRMMAKLGHLMLKNPRIAARIAELKAVGLAAQAVTVERVIAEYAKIAFADSREFYDTDGNLIPIHRLGNDIAGALAGVDVFNMPDGKGITKKIKVWDKKGALDSLAKHLNMFTDKVELTGKGGGPLQANLNITMSPEEEYLAFIAK